MQHLRATATTSTAAITTDITYVCGIAMASNGTGAAAVTVKDGGALGTTIAIVGVPAANQSRYVEFPGPVKVASLHLTLSANTQEAVAYFQEES